MFLDFYPTLLVNIKLYTWWSGYFISKTILESTGNFKKRNLKEGNSFLYFFLCFSYLYFISLSLSHRLSFSLSLSLSLSIYIYIYIYICIYIYIYISLGKTKAGHIRIINLFPSCYGYWYESITLKITGLLRIQMVIINNHN